MKTSERKHREWQTCVALFPIDLLEELLLQLLSFDVARSTAALRRFPSRAKAISGEDEEMQALLALKTHELFGREVQHVSDHFAFKVIIQLTARRGQARRIEIRGRFQRRTFQFLEEIATHLRDVSELNNGRMPSDDGEDLTLVWTMSERR